MPDMLTELMEAGDPAPIGHNRPSEADIARERVDALVENANRWAAERPEITDAETAAKATDFIDQLTAEAKQLDTQRRAEKRPHEEAAKAVDERWKPLLELVDACKRLLRPRHAAWLRREQDRLAAERRRREEEAARARRAAEAAAQKAAGAHRVEDLMRAQEAADRARQAETEAAAVPDRAQVRGNLGGRAHSLRTQWKATVMDLDRAMRHYRSRPELRELIERLACADARAGVREIPGCLVFSEEN